MGSSESNKFSINLNRLNKAHMTMKSTKQPHQFDMRLPSPSIWKLSHDDYTFLPDSLCEALALRLLHEV